MILTSDEEKRRRRNQMAGEAVLAAQTKVMSDTAERIPKAARGARVAARTAGAAPALIYDLANFARADDKWREGFAIAGGGLGGLAGGAMGGATGVAAPVAAPAGAAIGSAAGSNFATELYDQNYERIRPYTKRAEEAWEDLRENARRIADTKTWMAERTAQLLRNDPSFARILSLTGR